MEHLEQLQKNTKQSSDLAQLTWFEFFSFKQKYMYIFSGVPETINAADESGTNEETPESAIVIEEGSQNQETLESTIAIEEEVHSCLILNKS